MKPTLKRQAGIVTIAAALALGAAVATSAEYPVKPVRIIVPFSPGGGTDIQARVLAAKFQDSMGQSFIVDNRPGASGLIGADIAVAAPPDGYTILFSTATLAVNTTLYGKRMKFNPMIALTPISWITSTPLVLVVHPSVPATSVKDLVAHAQKNPGYLNAGINVPGSTGHLSMEMLKQMAGVEAVFVPYKGGGPAMSALISNEIDLLFATGPVAAPPIASGRVRGLAVTTPQRSSAFPDLPTMNSFFPGFESDNWYGMFFAAGTPRHYVAKINAEIAKALETDTVRAFMAKEGLDPVASTPEALHALLRREIAKYRNVITVAKIELP